MVRVDVHMQVAAASESVTVAAAATALQADRSDLRSEISGREYRDLPVPGARNYLSQALTEAMAGKAVSMPTTKPYGCSVKYPAS